ncbi:MAG: hypothetical protein CME60_02125 [Halobacteriovoraceae bacterium]|nr:hypothetical protein [Halobacteriovoraceae bacterium]|tara:strand:+ start:193373 stop:193870 length:498 start_codon:yes stop_codon:yes gene_type:complete
MLRLLKTNLIAALLLTLFMGIQSAQAAKSKILVVTNDEDSSYYDLYLELDEFDNAHGLSMYDHADKEWVQFQVKDLSKGVDLKKEGSHKVIVLKSDDFEHDRGGHFLVDYLNNGLTGKRSDLEITIDFDGHSWKVFHRGAEIEQLNFKVKKFLGKTVGIDRVEIQ